jgi:CCR4-NOT transcription complex subunit 6
MNALSRDNIAQYVILETTGMARGATRICVGNTHLYANYMRPDVRLWQTNAFLNELEHVLGDRDMAVLVCGDFNSEPDSAVYEYIKRGRISGIRPELSESNILPSLDTLHHSLEFDSLMNAATGSEPKFTNYTETYKGVLDYIWYTPGCLKISHVLVPPSEEEIRRLTGAALPNVNYPSDHIMLCSDMILLPDGSGSGFRRKRMSGRGR